MLALADQTAGPNCLAIKFISIMEQCAIYAFTQSDYEEKLNF